MFISLEAVISYDSLYFVEENTFHISVEYKLLIRVNMTGITLCFVMYTLKGKEIMVFKVKGENQFRRKDFVLVKYMLAKKGLFKYGNLK